MVVPDDSEEEGEVASQPESVAVNVGDEEEEEEAVDASEFELRPRKRSVTEPSTVETAAARPKRVRFMMRPLPPRIELEASQPTQPTPQSQLQQTTQTSLATAQGSSSSATAAINLDFIALQFVVMRLVADSAKHQETEQKMMAQIAQLEQRVEGQQGEIVLLREENRRLKTLEEEYAALQRSIYADEDGLVRFRIEGEGLEASRRGGAGDAGAGTSGTASGS